MTRWRRRAARGTPWRRPNRRRRSDDGEPLHSLGTLLADLATRCRNTCRVAADPDATAFTLVTQPTATQRRAAELIETFPVPGTA